MSEEVQDNGGPATAKPRPRGLGKLVTVGAAVAVVAGAVTFAAVHSTAEPRTVDVVAAPAKPQIDFARPFVGTPAEKWADGETGIAAPDAAPVGPFTKQQVTDAYAKVRQAVITSRLDRAVLEKHDVEQWLKLLAKDSQKKLRPVFTDDPHQAHAYATRLADGYTLLPAVPKVSGRMWAEQGTHPGELIIHTNYVFAYAFNDAHPEQLTDVMDIVAVDRWDVDYSVLTGKYAASSLGIWPIRSQGFTYSMGCQALREGYLAPSYSERRGSPMTDTPPHDRTTYFDPSSTLPATSTCTS
ncbi:hypothetical protein [Actinocrispum wychmicini]|uniref:Uncharacterized protein n=1 Tax=Actinocrispum wychmicini TaxID=1213861 RepID=A0A4R2J1V4_9PSEU|nr:hypothetical protein [Actinocrispum wychmicini]TCO50758.1 hypothetical protein EV192_113138 [Actinocrispum wychmicini]